MSSDEVMLVGYRFTFERDLVRVGMDTTVVLDAEPIAGPIYLEPWQNGLGVKSYVARCRGCNEGSRFYKRKSQPLRKWAHLHRCKPKSRRT